MGPSSYSPSQYQLIPFFTKNAPISESDDEDYDDEEEYEDEEEEEEYEYVMVRRPKQTKNSVPPKKKSSDDFLIDIDPKYFE